MKPKTPLQGVAWGHYGRADAFSLCELPVQKTTKVVHILEVVKKAFAKTKTKTKTFAQKETLHSQPKWTSCLILQT